MAVTAADVPGKYDLVINDGTNTTGFTFLRTLDGSYLSANRHRAEYTSSPTFVERQNVSNAYGDNSQDFFLTARNRDWSLGEQQKFFRAGHDGGYWMGQNVNVSTPGQVTLSPSVTLSASLAQAVVSGCRVRSAISAANLVGSTNLYQVDTTGVAIDEGAHGLGAIPAVFGCCTDGINAYFSTTAAGTVGVRKWDTASYATFSATAADSLVYLNNTLYGLARPTTTLIQYDTAGTATTLFTWKVAAGTSSSSAPYLAKIEAYGGKILILLAYGQEVGAELWIYDGSGTSRLEVFPSNFVAYDLEVLYGVAYVSGSFLKPASTAAAYVRPAIHFFDGSQVGLLWQANNYSTFTETMNNALTLVGPHPALTMYEGNLVFTDDTTGNLMLYNPSTGGVSTIGTYTVSGDTPRLVTSGTTIFHTRNQTTYRFFPDTTYPASGYVISSLIDFESSLTKQFRGVKLDFAAASDGNGGSVDIAYQIDSVDGSWTTLQTGAVSGTEYKFTNVSGHSIAVKVTLNKGTSTAGPTLKSLNVRGAPVLTPYEFRAYNLDLTNTSDHPTLLQDNSEHPLSGFDQAVKLRAALRSTTPVTVTDKFGTYTMLSEPANSSILEVHSGGTDASKPGQYIAAVTFREV